MRAQRCAQMRAQGWWGLWTKCKKVKCRGARRCACRGDGDSEPSAKRSNAEARAKGHADARTGVMGTLNQVQKGQMQRRAQRCTQRCAQMRAQGWWGLWTKCKKVKCRGDHKGARRYARRGDGDSEPSAKRSNAEARAKVLADACAGVMGTLNQVQKGQMQRHAQRCTQMRVQGWWGLWTKCSSHQKIHFESVSLFVLGYHWLPLATIDLVGNNREFEVWDIFWGLIPIIGGW